MKRHLITLAIIFSLLVPMTWSSNGVSVVAQERQRVVAGAATRTATARAIRPQTQFVNRVLANGLEVVVLEDHSVPLVTVEMAVKNGSYTEPPELNGLSHLYEHMFFKANRATANEEEYVNKVYQIGMAYNGQTQEEIVNYYFTTTSLNFPTAIRFMRDAWDLWTSRFTP